MSVHTVSLWLICSPKPLAHFENCILLSLLLLWFLGILYIFWIQFPCPILCIVNFFFLSVTCQLVFLMVLYYECTLLILMKSYQLYFSFMIDDFYILFKKILPKPNLWRYAPLFSSRGFMVLTFRFRSLCHLKLIFVPGVSLRSRIIL